VLEIVLKGNNMEVHRGELAAAVGTVGSSKSSMLSCIIGRDAQGLRQGKSVLLYLENRHPCVSKYCAICSFIWCIILLISQDLFM
jgi:Fe-S cluster assembly ATPase SufC